MKMLLSLCAIIMVFAISNDAVAGGHRGYGRHHFGFYGGMNYGYGHGGWQSVSGYGGQHFVVSGYGRGRFHNYRGYDGYNARYSSGGYHGNDVIYRDGYEAEQIYVYRPAPIRFYSYGQLGNCCPCQQW